MKFKGKTQVLLVELWRAVEKAEGRPTIHFIKRIAREAGATFSNDEAQRILLPFDLQANGFRRTENRAQTDDFPGNTKKERPHRGHIAATSRTGNRAQTDDSRTGNGQVADGNAGARRPSPVPYPNDVARARANDATKVKTNGNGAVLREPTDGEARVLEICYDWVRGISTAMPPDLLELYKTMKHSHNLPSRPRA